MKQEHGIYLLHKPFDVLCKFTDIQGRATLADYFSLPDYYPAGRLDQDSEGVVLLTNSGRWQHQISDPHFKWEKEYWVQVEGEISDEALRSLRQGVALSDFHTRQARAEKMDEPAGLWERSRPIRFRKNIPTSWLRLSIQEGKNRQVRRMTAAVGYPTLRLIRYRVGSWSLEGLAPGQFRRLTAAEIQSGLKFWNQ